MPDTIHDELIQSKGAPYRDSQLKAWSHYLEPINLDPSRLSGNSRIWGDATPEVQSRAIDSLTEASRAAGLGVRDTAHVLAIARIESGFNPDAAAGTSSASGLGQFIDKTGEAYGLDDTNRFDVDAQASALVAHFIDNRALAQRRGQDEAYIYKYHHDGPAQDYGGLALSQTKVMPLLEDYTRFVEQRFGIVQSHEDRAAPETAGGRGPVAPGGHVLLREGARGAAVVEVQTALAGLGFADATGAPLRNDGVFGPRTGEALRAFQQAHGLQIDGIAGPETRQALGRASAAQDIDRGSAPAAAAPLEALLTAARNGDPQVLQAAMDAFAETRFGQAFAQAQAAAVPGQDAHAQHAAQVETPAQCGPDR